MASCTCISPNGMSLPKQSRSGPNASNPEDGALTDLAYILSGTYFTHGLQDAADALFAEVHRSNMSKLDENGRPIYREDGKVLKSARFSEPDLRVICTGVTTNG